jgi:hypothetical protein
MLVFGNENLFLGVGSALTVIIAIGELDVAEVTGGSASLPSGISI